MRSQVPRMEISRRVDERVPGRRFDLGSDALIFILRPDWQPLVASDARSRAVAAASLHREHASTWQPIKRMTVALRWRSRSRCH
jgi:hypothetical protein